MTLPALQSNAPKIHGTLVSNSATDRFFENSRGQEQRLANQTLFLSHLSIECNLWERPSIPLRMSKYLLRQTEGNLHRESMKEQYARRP